MDGQTNRSRWQYTFLILLAAGLIASGLLLLILSEFHEEITQPWLSTLYQRAMGAVHAWTAPGLTRAMLISTFIGGWLFVTPTVVLLILLLLLRRARQDAALLALTVGGSAALSASQCSLAILIIIAVAIVLGIGLSRVYLGVHYPSDIAAGYLVGALWVSSVILALHYLEHRI